MLAYFYPHSLKRFVALDPENLLVSWNFLFLLFQFYVWTGEGVVIWKAGYESDGKKFIHPKIDIKVELVAQNKLLRFTIFGKNQKKQKYIGYVVN